MDMDPFRKSVFPIFTFMATELPADADSRALERIDSISVSFSIIYPTPPNAATA